MAVNIRVHVGKRSFQVAMKEEAKPVDHGWIETFLRLQRWTDKETHFLE